MSLSPLTFTGVSTYSTDFQTIMNRASAIAALPIKALQNQQTDLLQQKLLVSNLSTAVADLASALENIGTVSASKSLAASSSNTAKVTATNVSADNAAVYTISEISSISQAASETSVLGYADSGAVSATGLVQLKVGSNTYNLDITSRNTLAGLRDAINEQNAGVNATVFTTGTGATPNYLSVTASLAGATTLTLTDDPGGAAVELLTATNQGADTDFKLNGVAVKKQTNFINDVVPGVTFNILGTTSGVETVSVTLTSDKSRLSSALSSFVSAYNTLRTQVSDQVGEAAGLLSGDYLVREVQSRLRTLTNTYETSGTVHSLADLGITFESTGEAKFDSSVVTNFSTTQLEDAFGFLGTTTTGFAGLAADFEDISASVTGLAQIQLDNYETENQRLTDQIAVMTARATEAQKTLQAQLQSADALLASLQSQQSILTATIQSLNYSLYGKNEE
ncbi:MAG: flagellar filament capping protein FliD [Acidobacteria bacterium]|nr:flagellar filament capping protein FliD [Acidobacteriota bacterium]